MARYHFHVTDGGEHPDVEGVELTTAAEARSQALSAAGEMLRDASREDGPFGKAWSMRVTDPTGRVRFRLDFTLTESPER